MLSTSRFIPNNILCSRRNIIVALLVDVPGMSFHGENSDYIGYTNIIYQPENCMAIGTGFGQLFRGVGQVGGVAISSAIFQSKLETELRKRIHTPDADDVRFRFPPSQLVAIGVAETTDANSFFLYSLFD